MSEIVDLNELQEFHELLEISIGWKLLYRGSRDGFSASDFHDKCDEKPRTLTIIKTQSGDILGGSFNHSLFINCKNFIKNYMYYLISIKHLF